MPLRLFLFFVLLIPTTTSADHYLKHGSYFCELPWDYDGNQQETCFTVSEEPGQWRKEYDCLGYPMQLSDVGMTIKSLNYKQHWEKIAETYSRMDDGKEHLASIVLISKNDEGENQSFLATINFVYDKPNVLHLKTIEDYTTTWAMELNSKKIKDDPYLIKTFSKFSRCNFIE